MNQRFPVEPQIEREVREFMTRKLGASRVEIISKLVANSTDPTGLVMGKVPICIVAEVDIAEWLRLNSSRGEQGHSEAA
jgi:hypothetical protein